MIKVSLDEAYVFDMLAILDVKKQLFSSEKLDSVMSARAIMVDEICNQIGDDRFDEIISSEEYLNLIKANNLVFNLVDQTKTEGGLAKQVDDANYNRYLKKQNLQNKFFTTKMKEVKDEKYTSTQ
jgi:hypothetical protein